MTRSTIWRRAAAVLAVGALAVVGGAGAAQAAPTIDDPTETGSITVHKRLNPTGTLSNGNGLPDASAPGTPLDGIAFAAQRISTVDLTTTAGWTQARGYAAAPSTIVPADLVTAASSPQTTAAVTGSATFGNLPIGAYLVTEQLTPAQIASGLTAAAPFVVTVPMTHPVDLDTWLYEVHVYPKNLQSTAVKTVNDGPNTTYDVGDTIEWTVTSPVPTQNTTRFVFKDELSSHLGFVTPTATNFSVTLGGVALDAVDYVIVAPVAPTNTLIVRLTTDGLAKLNAATTGNVALTFTTTVNSLPADGIIANSAAIFPNASFSEDDPGVPTDPVVSRFGAINITKEEADSEDPLAGAEFKVFRSLDDANAYAAGEDDFAGNAAEYAALPLRALQNGAGSLTDTFVTGLDGKVSITGLRASNWQDGVRLTDPTTFQNYWLLETKAPAGYELATAPIGAITVFYDETTPTVLPSAAVTVPNVAKPELPLTGGQIATGVFGLLGALVLTGGVLLVIRARRQGAGA